MFISRFIAVLFLVSLCARAAGAFENFQYFIEGQSLSGPTGNIETSSPYVLPYRQWSFGLHRFHIGLDYGLLRHLEVGMSFDLRSVSELNKTDKPFVAQDEISLHAKYRLLREGEHPLSLAAGQYRDRFYLVAGKLFEQLRGISFQGGCSIERGRVSTFGAVTQTFSSEQFLLEYDSDGNRCNAGGRFLLSPEMKLDFFLTDFTRMRNIFFDNFYFGLTVAR